MKAYNMKSDTFLSPKVLEVARLATEAAAFACYDWIGKGDEKAADHAAVVAMREMLNSLDISARIVIGEGERDEAPMLFIGEELGLGGDALDIAVDPLEGTTICANGMQNSIAVMAIAGKGSLLHAPDVYMQKIAIGPNLPDNVVDLDERTEVNIRNLAKAKKKDVSDIVACVLKRPRHEEMIAKIRETGARVHMIGDGDVSAAIATTICSAGVDIYMGSGGAPEGVLTAAALSCTGGFLQGRLLFASKEQEEYAKRLGINDMHRKYGISDMVQSDVVFGMTGVTDGWLVDGVRVEAASKQSNTLIMHRGSGLISKVHNRYLAQS